MYNRLYKRLIKLNIICSKQFGFQKGYSTDHVLLEVIDQIDESSGHNSIKLLTIKFC